MVVVTEFCEELSPFGAVRSGFVDWVLGVSMIVCTSFDLWLLIFAVESC